MKMHNEIKVQTDSRGNRFHIVYDRSGKEVHIGQLMDAENAIRTGAYTAQPPDKKKK